MSPDSTARAPAVNMPAENSVPPESPIVATAPVPSARNAPSTVPPPAKVNVSPAESDLTPPDAAAEARLIAEALRGVVEAMEGGEFEPRFADLIGREPQLPEHLR